MREASTTYFHWNRVKRAEGVLVYRCRQPQGDSYASLLRSPHPRSCCFPPAPLATFPAETSPSTSKLQRSEDPSCASSTAQGGIAICSDTGRHRSFPSNHTARGADRRGLLSAFRTEVSRRFWPYVHSYARFFEKSHTKALQSLTCTPWSCSRLIPQEVHNTHEALGGVRFWGGGCRGH